MRPITILCVGKLKEKYWKDAADEYSKRLSAYCDLKIEQVQDEKAAENLSKAQKQKVKDKEGEKLLSKLPDNTYLIALTIDGKKYTSERLSSHIEKIQSSGDGRIAFAIGGSLGLSEAVVKRADEKMSFSDLTFPHQLARVILLEQIYRSFKIRSGEPYHK